MTAAQFIALLETARWIGSQVEGWAENLRAKGELTPEADAAYQAHQKAVYDKPEAQPRDAQPSGS